MSSDYKSLYLRNCYEVEQPSTSPFFFSLEPFIDTIFFDRPFCIVTAFNPRNRVLSLEENQQRNQQLYSTLYKKDYEVLKATGCLEGHCEAGFLIYDIPLSEALELGLMYEQYAIFYNDGGCLKYVVCETKEIIVEKIR